MSFENIYIIYNILQDIYKIFRKYFVAEESSK